MISTYRRFDMSDFSLNTSLFMFDYKYLRFELEIPDQAIA